MADEVKGFCCNCMGKQSMELDRKGTVKKKWCEMVGNASSVQIFKKVDIEMMCKALGWTFAGILNLFN